MTGARHARPRGHRRAYVLTAITSAILAMIITSMAVHLITFDHWFGAYGVSVGTDTHYCSADLITENRTLALSCEHAP